MKYDLLKMLFYLMAIMLWATVVYNTLNPETMNIKVCLFFTLPACFAIGGFLAMSLNWLGKANKNWVKDKV